MSFNNARPRNSKHDSSAVRESVFDVFVQLGGLQENSLLKQWMFEGTPTEGRAGRGRTEVRHKRYDEGPRVSPVEEKMFFDETEEENGGLSRGRSQSKKGKLTAKLLNLRSRSKSKSTKSKKSATSTSSEVQDHDVDSSTKSPSLNRQASGKKPRRFWPMGSSSSDHSFEQDQSHSSPSPVPTLPDSVITQRSATFMTLEGKSSKGDLSSKSSVTSLTSKNRMFSRRMPMDVEKGAERIQAETDSEHVESLPSNSSETRIHLSGLDHALTDGGPDNGKTKTATRLSFLLPRSAFPCIELPGKRKKDRRPPNLAPIPTNNDFDRIDDVRGVSTSLPPSPFILVTPEVWGDHEDGASPTTPYVFCSPLDGSLLHKQMSGTSEALNSPVYPVSVSKTLRRTLLESDNLQDMSDVDIPTRRRAVSALGPYPSIDTISSEISSPSRPPLSRSSSLRARENPFPIRPIRPLPLSLTMQGTDPRAVRLSLDARASVLRQRYKGNHDRLYQNGHGIPSAFTFKG